MRLISAVAGCFALAVLTASSASAQHPSDKWRFWEAPVSDDSRQLIENFINKDCTPNSLEDIQHFDSQAAVSNLHILCRKGDGQLGHVNVKSGFYSGTGGYKDFIDNSML